MSSLQSLGPAPEQVSLEFMARAKNWGQHRFVCWSGGRDSTTVLHLALRAWGSDNFKAVFVDTGITLPETLDFVARVAAAWGLELDVVRAPKDFWAYAKQHGFPSIVALWCRTHFKLRPLKRYMRKHRGWTIQALGIRRLESTRRMHARVYKQWSARDLRVRYSYTLHPIKDWTSQDVRRYARKHGLPENPAYKIFGTSGCYYCPFVQNPRHYLTLKAVHPDLFQKILEAQRAIKSDFQAIRRIQIEDLAKQATLKR